MSRKEKEVHPRTVEEAKVLLERAIENADFEEAERISQEMSDLKVFEEEMDLGQLVSGYFDRNIELSHQYESNCQTYENQVSQALETANEAFKKEFQKLKKKQEREIDQLFAKWRASREIAMDEAEKLYENALTMARLVAKDGRYKEAAQMRDDAMKAKIVRCTQSNTEVDAHYEKQVQMTITRHNSELKSLISRRNHKLTELKAMMMETQQQALGEFNIGNAYNVVDIAKRFTVNSKMPLSLRMQTVHGRPNAIRSGIDNSFERRMFDPDATRSMDSLPEAQNVSPIVDRKRKK